MPFKRISADEALSKRKDHVRETPKGNAIMKAAKAAPSWDKEARTARFVMTTQQVDRYGDIVMTEGINTLEFERNPVAPLCHNTRTWPIGSWANLEKVLKGRPPRMEGDLILLPADGPVKEIAETEWMLANGGIRACSIGFVPDWDAVEGITDDDGYWKGLRFNASELIECSPCVVPANPGALAKMVDGNMTIARELLEDILDNWARSPEGVLLRKSDFEKAHKAANGERTHFILSKDLINVRTPNLKVEKLAATTDEDAKQFIGCTVQFSPTHPLNRDDASFAKIGKEAGEIVASYIVEDGEKKGTHALWVEFTTTKWTGMFRGIAAERFHLVTKPKAEQSELPVTDEDKAAAEVRSIEFEVAKAVIPSAGLKAAVEGDVDATLIVVDGKWKLVGKTADDEIAHVVMSCSTVDDKREYQVKHVVPAAGKVWRKSADGWAEKDGLIIDGATMARSVILDFNNSMNVEKLAEELHQHSEESKSLIDTVYDAFGKLFGRSPTTKSDPIDSSPEKPTAPTPEAIAAARSRADDALARLKEAGRI